MKQEEVLQRVQEIEKLGDNLKQSSSMSHKNTLHSQIISLCEYISTASEKVDYNFVIEVIDLLKMFNTKYKFQSLFKFPPDLSLLFSHIRSFYQQNFWKLQDLIKDLKETELIFQNEIFQGREYDLFGIPHPLFAPLKVYYCQEAFHLVNCALICSENFLQHTAVLSQLKQN